MKRVALLDLDGSVADFEGAITKAMESLRSPGEPPWSRSNSAPHIQARLDLIKRQPGFWRDLKPLPNGLEIVEELRAVGFDITVLTRGPSTKPAAWAEKHEWCRKHLPDVRVTITENKALVYGRVLVDDWSPYFKPWLEHRPRALVVVPAQEWNAKYGQGSWAEPGSQVFRYDGTNRPELRARLQAAFDRM